MLPSPLFVIFVRLSHDCTNHSKVMQPIARGGRKGQTGFECAAFEFRAVLGG